MKTTLYIAYGSNMNLEQMARRCPTARMVGTATLTGYALFFRGGHGGAVATVEPSKKGKVPVLVWRLKPADEAALDRYEGWPTLYRKETVTIEIIGKAISAMVYIMNDGRPLGQPSLFYFNVIREGYLAAGLDTAPLFRALRRSVPPPRSI